MTLETFAAQLSSEDERDRIYAAEDIGSLKDEAGVPPLVSRLLIEPSRAVRDAIFSALQAMPSAAITPNIMPLLNHDDPYLRNEGIALLSRQGVEAVPIFTELLSSADPDLRKFAIDALAQQTGTVKQELLTIAVFDQDINVAIAALENFMPPASKMLRTRVLEKALHATHPMLEIAALDALVRIGDGESYERVRGRFATLREVDTLYLPTLLQLLGAQGGDAALAELETFLVAPEQVYGAAILEAMTQIVDRQGKPLEAVTIWRSLISYLDSATAGSERSRAIRLLGRYAQLPEVEAELLALIVCSKREDRLSAIGSFEPGPDARSLFRTRLLIETDLEVKTALQDALTECEG